MRLSSVTRAAFLCLFVSACSGADSVDIGDGGVDGQASGATTGHHTVTDGRMTSSGFHGGSHTTLGSSQGTTITTGATTSGGDSTTSTDESTSSTKKHGHSSTDQTTGTSDTTGTTTTTERTSTSTNRTTSSTDETTTSTRSTTTTRQGGSSRTTSESSESTGSYSSGETSSEPSGSESASSESATHESNESTTTETNASSTESATETNTSTETASSTASFASSTESNESTASTEVTESSTDESGASSSSEAAGAGNGASCQHPDDCATGNCVDGVCCNKPCAGACEACTAAKKGHGQDGQCGAAQAGDPDPRGICATTNQDTCGDKDGTCNNAGACTKWPSGTVCDDALCNGNTLDNASTCDGAGHCDAAQPATTLCAPYLCDDAACTTGCGDNGDCSTDLCMNPGNNGTCVFSLDQGQPCVHNTDCTSTVCADGVCCNVACGSACEACTAALKGQGVDGVCGSVVKDGVDPHGVCTSSAASTCGDEAAECDGSGACLEWPSGTVCVAASCESKTVLTNGSTCSGTGACDPPAQPTHDCTPYACSGGACDESCSDDGDCAGGAYCTTQGVAGGSCVSKQATGFGCSANDQCSNGDCVDGFCCNSACNGQCQACSHALTGGTNGTCADVSIGGVDPSGDCEAAAPVCMTASCGANATCAFANEPDGTTCPTGTCTDGLCL